jgi:hypothetical protein
MARARNLSPEGMYVETTKLTIPTGTMVEIELDRWNREWRIPAIVVHGDARGAGLMFQSALPELYQCETAAGTSQRPPAKSLEPMRFPAGRNGAEAQPTR